jgi:hypothetical protein
MVLKIVRKVKTASNVLCFQPFQGTGALTSVKLQLKQVNILLF